MLFRNAAFTALMITAGALYAPGPHHAARAAPAFTSIAEDSASLVYRVSNRGGGRVGSVGSAGRGSGGFGGFGGGYSGGRSGRGGFGTGPFFLSGELEGARPIARIGRFPRQEGSDGFGGSHWGGDGYGSFGAGDDGLSGDDGRPMPQDIRHVKLGGPGHSVRRLGDFGPNSAWRSYSAGSHRAPVFKDDNDSRRRDVRPVARIGKGDHPRGPRRKRDGSWGYGGDYHGTGLGLGLHDAGFGDDQCAWLSTRYVVTRGLSWWRPHRFCDY